MAGKVEDMFSFCFKNTKYIWLMCINHFCMLCSVFENNEHSRLESRRFGGILSDMIFR